MILEFISGRYLTNASNFCRQMINCMKAWNYLQKILDIALNTEIIKQTHGLTIKDEKDVLTGEYRKSRVFAGYHIFGPAAYIERYMEDAVFRFYESMIQLWPLQICLEALSISIHWKMETEEFNV